MTMTPERLKHYEGLLLEEKKTLEAELATVGRINPENPKDWQPTPSNLNIDPSDENDLSDSIVQYENNTAILKQLEIRFNEVTEAIERINSGTFGKCEVDEALIEEDRLEANPAARTCKAHMNASASFHN